MKKLFFVLTIICLPLFAFSETEPNDAAGQANILGVNASDAGTLDAVDVNGWWKITVPSDGKLIINTTSAATLDIDLFLYDINGTTQIASYDTSTGIHEATHYNSLMPGTYFVNAHHWTGSGSYTISSIFTATAFANDIENNDSFQVAKTLTLNGSSTGHLYYYSNGYTDLNDWWKIVIPADGKLVVNTTSDATLDIDLFLYDINGNTQIASYDTSTGIHEAIHYNNLMPGTYFVNVHHWTGYGSYTISSIFTATAFANDIENNDSFQVAKTLTLNGSSTGHLYFYSNGYNDLRDWWKITTPTIGNLVVNTTSDATLDIDLFLYSTDGTTQIASYDTSTGIHEATHYNNLAAGTYYVLVKRWTGYGSYTIASVLSPQTGIENNLSSLNEVSVFPNPSSGVVNIIWDNNNSAVVEIYNVVGQLIMSRIITQKNNVIDLNDFEKGMYFIRTESNEKSFINKIILTK